MVSQAHRGPAISFDGNRIALVTGAGAGIGRAVALALGARGYTLVLNDIDADRTEEVTRQVGNGPGSAIACPGDLADEAFIRVLFQEIEAQCGRLDVIVHSAGLFPKLSFRASRLVDLDRVMSVNFRAAVALALSGRALMTGRKTAMIFLTSGSGLLTAVSDPMQRDFSFYGASKAALDRWALGIASELAEEGISINTITPGAFVETPGVLALGLREAGERPGIAPEKVAEAVAWLADRPEKGPSGERLRATQFGSHWGPAD